MIIKPKPFPPFVIKTLAVIFSWFFRRRFNKLVIHQAKIRPGHSYLLMCNHFSFLDGMFMCYLSYHGIHKKENLGGMHIMMLDKQLKKNKWLRRLGGFSIAPGRPSVNESLEYAAEVLSKPGNILFMFPQGNLESMHVRRIELKDGVSEIAKQITGKCQFIWSSNIVEYFEGFKASVYFHMLDCGTAADFDFEQFSDRVNTHHKAALKKHLRFTEDN